MPATDILSQLCFIFRQYTMMYIIIADEGKENQLCLGKVKGFFICLNRFTGIVLAFADDL